MRFVYPLLVTFILVCTGSDRLWGAIVWSGFDIAFTRPSGIDSAHPQYRDEITSAVALARGALAGLFNAAVEDMYTATSPAGTRWATDLVSGNAGLTITATNWEQLSFSDWRSAYEGSNDLRDNIVARNAVVHLMADDIYFDIRFTSWESGRDGGLGGGFSYLRSAPPSDLLGDFDLDGDIDGRDFLTWQRGDSPNPLSTADLAIWQAEYGSPFALSNVAILPEPATCGLGLLALVTRFVYLPMQNRSPRQLRH